MKSLLRKKNQPDNRQKPSPPSLQNVRQPSSPETPLYARFASTASAQEKGRPIVSGPMPLGRPGHAPLDTGRRRNGEPAVLRHKSSNSRQETPPAAQFPPSAVSRDLPPLPDRSYQDARVGLAEAAIQPHKAQADCTSCFSFASVPRHSWLCQHVIVERVESMQTCGTCSFTFFYSLAS